MNFIGMRSVLVFASTAFSILLIMLFLNIITVDETASILKLSPEGTSALKLVVSRVQEVSNNLLSIISQLLNHLFSWAEVDIDLSKVNVDVNKASGATNAIPAEGVVADPNTTGSGSQK